MDAGSGERQYYWGYRFGGKLPEQVRQRSADFHQHLERGSNLGKGGQGEVYKVFMGSGGGGKKQVYALKKIKIGRGLKDINLREVHNHVKLSGVHPGFVKVYDWWMDDNNKLYILMEYCESGSLFRWLKNRDSTPKLQAFRQIVEAVDAMHKRNVMHRDLKPENIFISAKHGWKLGDFGISKFHKVKEGTCWGEHTAGMGTSLYMAPEVVDYHVKRHGKNYYGTKSDIFSLGVMLAELLAPPEAWKAHRVKMLKSIYEGEFEQQHSPNRLDLLNKMLSHDQDERPTASQVLKHPVFVKEEKRRRKELASLQGNTKEDQDKRRELEKFEPRNTGNPEHWPIPGPTVPIPTRPQQKLHPENPKHYEGPKPSKPNAAAKLPKKEPDKKQEIPKEKVNPQQKHDNPKKKQDIEPNKGQPKKHPRKKQDIDPNKDIAKPKRHLKRLDHDILEGTDLNTNIPKGIPQNTPYDRTETISANVSGNNRENVPENKIAIPKEANNTKTTFWSRLWKIIYNRFLWWL